MSDAAPARPGASALPSGTVTFLFTDIEHSTALLQALGERYAAVLAEERALLRDAFAAHSGNEVDTQGDAFFVAFGRAEDAVAAAVAGQRAVATHPWPDGAAVRVRMGLHTGTPLLSGGGYVGLDVHRAARISAAGHGGQILLSAATRALVERDLPDGASLRDLGEYRLKDLRQPERLAQLTLPGLPSDFPPLKTLDQLAHNLPIQPTPLLGREREVAEVSALLGQAGVRLLTLSGPGGIGKTRLALQVAAELGERYADGVYFIELAAIVDPALVAATIARALRLREIADRALDQTLCLHLSGRHVLLVLDNFEQIVPAGSLVAHLLAMCPDLKILVTSREVLHLQSEQEYPVPPLALPRLPTEPDHGADAALGTVVQSPAVTLFVERARAARPDFRLSAANARAIAEICARLDGLPLAIELAAARVKLMTPQALLARLARRLALLTDGPRDLPARQRTLRDTIAWSDDLLSENERLMFRRLAVFAGGWTLEAVEGVCPIGRGLTGTLLDGLASLMDKSLVREHQELDGETRFGMLETIREYALDQLEATGELESLRAEHAAYYLALAERAEPALTGPEQAEWLARLEREHDNVRAALAWARETGNGGLGLRLAVAVWRFWYTHGHVAEGLAWLEMMLLMAPEDDPGAAPPLWAGRRARALYGAATLANIQGDDARASALFERSLALSRQIDDKPAAAGALNALGVMVLQGGDVDRAIAYFEESLDLSRAGGDAWAIGRALVSLGQSAYVRGDHERAAAYLRECLDLMRREGSQSYSAVALINLGHVMRAQRRYDRAAGLYREALALSEGLGDRLRMARALDGLAATDAALSEHARAARLLGAAEAIRESLGAGPHPIDRPSLDDTRRTLQAALGDDALDRAVTDGRAMPPEEIARMAEATRPVKDGAPHAPA